MEQQPLDKGAKRAGGDVDEVSERPVFSVNGADGVKCSQRKRSFRLLSGNFSNGTAHVRERTGKGALPEHVSVARGGWGETLAGCMGWRAAGDPQSKERPERQTFQRIATTFLEQLHLFCAARCGLLSCFGADGNAGIEWRLEQGHPVVPERLHLGQRRRASHNQDLGSGTARVPKPPDHLPFGNIAPVQASILVRAFGKLGGRNIYRRAAFAPPPSQPLAPGKPAPEDPLKPVAAPDRDEASGPVLGSRGFKGGAHRGKGWRIISIWTHFAMLFWTC